VLIVVDTRVRRVGDPISAKSALRRQMRSLRRALPDRAERSERLWAHVEALPAFVAASTVMAFDSIPGEPATAAFIARCRAGGKRVVLPEDAPPPDPGSLDLVVVPGTAFTPAGHRLGQGGGWYDRFLPLVRPGCVTVGVGFELQVLPSLPVEPHDVVLDIVVTEAGAVTDVARR